MHYDVTIHDVTAIINQICTAYRNSLLNSPGIYLFQASSIGLDSWVWREVKEREKKKRREIPEDIPLPYPLSIFPAHIFLHRPHNELTPVIGWAK